MHDQLIGSGLGVLGVLLTALSVYLKRRDDQEARDNGQPVETKRQWLGIDAGHTRPLPIYDVTDEGWER